MTTEYPTGDTQRAEQVTGEGANEAVANVRTIERYSMAQGTWVTEVTTNPLYEGVAVNTIIGRRVSGEGLDWGLFSLKVEQHYEPFSLDEQAYWDHWRRSWKGNLEHFGVEWEPDLVF